MKLDEKKCRRTLPKGEPNLGGTDLPHIRDTRLERSEKAYSSERVFTLVQ